MRTETRRVVPHTRFLLAVTVVLAVVGIGIRAAGAGEPGTCAKAAAPPQKPAVSAPAPNDAAKAAQTSSGEAAGQAGMRAFVDPATGQLREPTAEEAATLNGSSSGRLPFRRGPRSSSTPTGC